MSAVLLRHERELLLDLRRPLAWTAAIAALLHGAVLLAVQLESVHLLPVLKPGRGAPAAHSGRGLDRTRASFLD